jgi:hypothetical protein
LGKIILQIGGYMQENYWLRYLCMRGLARPTILKLVLYNTYFTVCVNGNCSTLVFVAHYGFYFYEVLAAPAGKAPG